MGELDDALHRVDAQQAAQAARQEFEQRRQDLQDALLVHLIDDFVRRMNAAGNPGTDWHATDGRFLKKRTPGWIVKFGTGDHWQTLPIRVDGLVAVRDPRRTGVYAPPAQAGYNDFVAFDLDRFARGLAELLHANDVR